MGLRLEESRNSETLGLDCGEMSLQTDGSVRPQGGARGGEALGHGNYTSRKALRGRPAGACGRARQAQEWCETDGRAGEGPRGLPEAQLPVPGESASRAQWEVARGGLPLITAPLPQAAHCVLGQDPENQALARFYCHTERIIAKRLVLRR